MIKRMILMVLALAVVFGGIFGWKYYQGMLMQQMMASKEEPPVTVTTAEAEAETWQPELKAVASLRAESGVAVSPELDGRVAEIPFESGQEVDEGDLLVAQSTATEEAELERLRARRELAEARLRRQRRLVEQDQTSQEAVDEAAAELKTLEAQIQGQREAIAKKHIRAPFAGVLGIRNVDRGQFVSPGQDLVTIQALEPLHADFDLPQQSLGRVRVGMPVRLTVDTFPDRTFEGEVTAIEPEVAQETRNFAVRATLPNEDRSLRPGMFAQAAVQLPEQGDVVTLPQTAVSTDPYGESVFVVEEAEDEEEPSTVTKRFVRTGERRGDQVAIEEGVESGETVVTSGQLKLEEGARIQVDNSVQPGNDPEPQPANK
ncbi:MAG: efflux RND transporter periplasmic adaptor subunit [Thiohalorhabdus sp.]|uniref:efflux RND transporter periplasmic adaptor subunit n=1 Tax=Thiohalorhabdus sp. TaxID=3094134 RepID=UPI003980F274